MKRLEKLTAENNKLRRKVKAKRTKWGSSSSEEEDSSNEEDVSRKEKPRSKRVCYNCGKNGTSLPNAHMRGRKKTMIRERSLIKATRKTRNILRRSLMVKLLLVKNRTQVMIVPSRKVMKWQP
jgi:hypothetical protein